MTNKGNIMTAIIGYEGLYSISANGDVYSHKGKGKFLKGRNRGGYLRVSLTRDGKAKNFSIHRLVAENFIENPCDKSEVNHKNGIKSDNRVENLEWVTPSENIQHAVDTGLHPQTHQARFSIDEMSEICEAYATGIFSMREIARFLKTSHAVIGGIVNNKTFNRGKILC